MIRIAIAAEYAIARWALHEALANVSDFMVVGEAGTVQETLEMVQRVTPDVLVLDPAVPDHSQLDVLAELRDLAAGPVVLVLSPQAEPSRVARVIAAGAHGFVGMDSSPELLVRAIRSVSSGEQVIPPDGAKYLAGGDWFPASALTNRELQVMEMLGRGLTNREIAAHLGISIKTVDTHRGHVMKKLALRNNSELTRYAVKHGYVTL